VETRAAAASMAVTRVAMAENLVAAMGEAMVVVAMAAALEAVAAVVRAPR